MLEVVCAVAAADEEGAKPTSSRMGSKAARERHSSMTGAFLETVLRTSLMGVSRRSVALPMLTGVQFLSMASVASGRSCEARRSSVSCQSASASDSRGRSMIVLLILEC